MVSLPYSKAKANPGMRGGEASVWKRRVDERRDLAPKSKAQYREARRLEMCRNEGATAVMEAVVEPWTGG